MSVTREVTDTVGDGIERGRRHAYNPETHSISVKTGEVVPLKDVHYDPDFEELMGEAPRNMEGRKDDAGKDGFEYLPPDALAAINKVLVFGAKKYGARNWEKGMKWTRPANAAFRHGFAWLRGEKADPETGFSHLWHLGCCVLFLIAYELRGIGEDDRV